MSVRLDLLNDALTVASENYKDNVRIFANLDDKAQKVGAIAGLFLGAMFAFIKPDSVRSLVSDIGYQGTSSLTGVVQMLMLCILICLAAMWVGKISPPLSLWDVTNLTNDYLHYSEAELTEVLQEEYRQEKLAAWRMCIQQQERVVSNKLVLVFMSQIVLLLAVLWVASVLLGLLHVARTGSIPS